MKLPSRQLFVFGFDANAAFEGQLVGGAREARRPGGPHARGTPAEHQRPYGARHGKDEVGVPVRRHKTRAAPDRTVPGPTPIHIIPAG